MEILCGVELCSSGQRETMCFVMQEHPKFREGLRSETRLLILDSVAGVVSPILGGAPPFEASCPLSYSVET